MAPSLISLSRNSRKDVRSVIAALFRLGVAFPFLISCSGNRETNFSYLSSTPTTTEVDGIDPASVSSMVTSLDTRKTSTLQKLMMAGASSVGPLSVGGVVATWSSSQGDQFVPDTGLAPKYVSLNGLPWVQFDGGNDLFAQGRLPEHLGTQFSFVIVGMFPGNGFSFRFGSDDSTEAFWVKLASSQFSLSHSSSTGNLRTRTSSAPQASATPQVLVFTFGAQSKDLEVYENGFRMTTPVTSGMGAPTSFQNVARDIKIVHQGGATPFYVGQFLIFNEKLSPQKIYGISKFLASGWGAVVSSEMTPEILNDVHPPVEPDTVDSAHIFSTILQPKCVSCHRVGGSGVPAFADIAALRTARGSGNILILNAGSSATSSLYQTVLSGSMPFGGSPLSATDQKALKDWIDAGAP